MSYTPDTWADLDPTKVVSAARMTKLGGQYSAAMADTAALYGKDVHPWAPSTAYSAGQAVLSPLGDVVTAKTAHTSSATFSGTGAGGNWNLSTTFEPAGLSTTTRASSAMKWQPNTAYAAGQVVISPTGSGLLTSTAAHTSGASFSGLAQKVTPVVKTNLAVNPNAAGANGFVPNNATINTVTKNVAITGHPQGITTAAKSTMTAGHANTTAVLNCYNMDTLGTSNPARYIGAWVNPSVNLRAYWTQDGLAKAISVPANTWTWVPSIAQTPANTYAFLAVVTTDGSNVTDDTSFVLVTGVTADANAPVTESIWGGRTPTTGVSYAWTGAANASTSTQTTLVPGNWTKTAGYLDAKLDFSAKGDGATDDTATLQTAFDAATNTTLFVPPGTYMVNANLANSIGLKITKPKTHIILDENAILKVITNAADSYTLLSITGADAVVEGGIFWGDVSAHTGTTGEWGHLISVDAGGDRALLRNLVAREAWGDGIIIQNGPADVVVENVMADSNRRQGMSVTGATRFRCTNSTFKNTGQIKYTLPYAGVDVEPNTAGGIDVIDALFIGCHFTGNRGEGALTIRASARTTEAMFVGCSSVGNGASGFRAGGSAGTSRTRWLSCRSQGNAVHGYDLYADGTVATGCAARANTQNGFESLGAGSKIIDPDSIENGGHGIHVPAGVGPVSIVGGTSTANSQTTTNTSSNVNVDATPNVRIVGHVAAAGTLTNKPKYGYELLTGAGVRMFSCDVVGAHATGDYINTPGATIVPLPGFARQAVITAPTAAGATYSQTQVQSLVDAVNAMKATLTAAGLTA